MPRVALDLNKDADRQNVKGVWRRGPGLVPFAFSKGSHAGDIGAQVGIIHSGTIHYVGKPLITDDGSGAITPYTGGQPQAPATGIPPS